MSKSLGNFFTARECFKLAEPEALRYLVLGVHYRAPLALDWTLDDNGQVIGFPQVEEAERRIEYLYRTHERLMNVPEARMVDAGEASSTLNGFGDKLAAALDDDLNTPIALAVTAELLKHVNELCEHALTKKGRMPRPVLTKAKQALACLSRVLGIGGQEHAEVLARIRARRAARLGLSEADVERRIGERVTARAERDFARADAIRDELLGLGVELMDGAGGTAWRIP
jgi:cysteinyl-tRNA synthetase